MESKDTKDPLKGVDWKAVGGEMQQNPSVQPTLKKRLPKKMRQIPDYYFLPRWPLSSALLFCSACVAGGVAAGMLVETWIQKKVKEDGGVIWEFDK
ncbi:uncharacterized protein LOC109813235 [Cajanus cajan]|uniref:Uncharacterized protein n=1 Tax=Cajanus cajan TaxID=3821 RepID=A0A151S4C9_CAJCA|nr:uncharacterized protein LOC109813235 [Cajanus cajan]XP_029130192.1 uncharacterized protein LOC109813235 [Cajanus cajan]KYP49662.1 hypothetical protein KK1_028634 [Cajanus cajan]